jgi:hypothetical protein
LISSSITPGHDFHAFIGAPVSGKAWIATWLASAPARKPRSPPAMQADSQDDGQVPMLPHPESEGWMLVLRAGRKKPMATMKRARANVCCAQTPW